MIGAPLPRLRGVTGSLARRNAMRNPRRTAGTATALMVGVGVVTLFTVFAASIKASVDDTVAGSVDGELVISSGNFGGGGLSPQLATRHLGRARGRPRARHRHRRRARRRRQQAGRGARSRERRRCARHRRLRRQHHGADSGTDRGREVGGRRQRLGSRHGPARHLRRRHDRRSDDRCALRLVRARRQLRDAAGDVGRARDASGRPGRDRRARPTVSRWRKVAPRSSRSPRPTAIPT